MRKTLLFLSVIGLLITSCDRANSSKKSEWMISVTVNGVENKAEGTRYNNYISLNDNDNLAYTGFGAVPGQTSFLFSMMDKSDESYVKGDSYQFGLTKLGGLDEGDNEFIFSQTGYLSSDNIFIPGATLLQSNDTITINITDLGTPTEIADYSDLDSYYDFGKPVKGNGTGNLNFTYILDDKLGDTVINVAIDFIAVRYN